MKRTLVERVAMEISNNAMTQPWSSVTGWVRESWKREARHIIAMVRRHDRKEKGK